MIGLSFILYLMAVTDSQSYLPFLNFSANASLLNGILDHAEMFILPSSITFGNQTYGTLYISTHGLISFGVSHTAYIPALFPISTPVVAAFWDDSDLTGKGYARFELFNITYGYELNITNKVKNFIATIEGIAINPDWVFVARWIDVCPYQNKDCLSPAIQPNTFQIVLVSQGTVSYAIMTYKCGHIQWTDYNAVIGYSYNATFFANHPLSKSSNVTNIDCLNYPQSEWTNLVYKISDGDALICVNGWPVHMNMCQCNDGWTGLACDQFHCVPNCTHGTCVGPNKCQCHDGWQGRSCSIYIKQCRDRRHCIHSNTLPGNEGQATSCIPGHEPSGPSLYLRVCCVNSNLGKTVRMRENNHVKIILCPSVKPHSCSSIMT